MVQRFAAASRKHREWKAAKAKFRKAQEEGSTNSHAPNANLVKEKCTHEASVILVLFDEEITEASVADGIFAKFESRWTAGAFAPALASKIVAGARTPSTVNLARVK